MDFNTLQEAKDYVARNRSEGVHCPCCDQFSKMYSRTITGSMALALIMVYKSNKKDFFHLEDYLKQCACSSAIRGDVAKLKYWGLLQPKVEERDDGSKRNGFYKLTEKGIFFVEGSITVAKYVRLYNQKCYGFHGEQVGIEDVLGTKFSYSQLMGR